MRLFMSPVTDMTLLSTSILSANPKRSLDDITNTTSNSKIIRSIHHPKQGFQVHFNLVDGITRDSVVGWHWRWCNREDVRVD
mmetsp:Transcript_16950/g.35654  ORF Transcript_16950/g.35654 Transcript_16950/m.35654 type:complete len:82 (+) Transcript_16950:90-335(+)